MALGVLLALALLELTALLLGGSLVGADQGAGEPDLDIAEGPEADLLDADMDAAGGAEIVGADLDLAAEPSLAGAAPEAEIAAALAEIDGGSAASAPQAGAASAGFAGALLWLGVGRAPFIVWLAAFLCGFGATGLALQSLVAGLFGAPAPWPLAILPALIAGLALAKTSAQAVARALPNVKTSAVAAADLGGRLGVVTGPAGRPDRPTEVRVTDRHGRPHYLRAAPLDSDGVLPPRADVIVLRRPVRGVHRAIPLDDARDRVGRASA